MNLALGFAPFGAVPFSGTVERVPRCGTFGHLARCETRYRVSIAWRGDLGWRGCGAILNRGRDIAGRLSWSTER
jgi:hypothetical protein